MGSLARWSVGLMVIGATIAATTPVATVWLIVTDPVGVADIMLSALTTGDVGPFIRAVGAVIFEALGRFLGYL